MFSLHFSTLKYSILLYISWRNHNIYRGPTTKTATKKQLPTKTYLHNLFRKYKCIRMNMNVMLLLYCAHGMPPAIRAPFTATAANLSEHRQRRATKKTQRAPYQLFNSLLLMSSSLSWAKKQVTDTSHIIYS